MFITLQQGQTQSPKTPLRIKVCVNKNTAKWQQILEGFKPMTKSEDGRSLVIGKSSSQESDKDGSSRN